MAGRQEGVEPLDRVYDLSSLGGEWRQSHGVIAQCNSARRSPAGTGSGSRTAHRPGSAPPCWRPPRPSNTPSGRRAPPSVPAQLLKALGKQRQCGLGPLVGGEPHEPVAAPGQHRTKTCSPPSLPSRSPAPHPVTTPPGGGRGDGWRARRASPPRPADGSSAPSPHSPRSGPPAAAAWPRSDPWWSAPESGPARPPGRSCAPAACAPAAAHPRDAAR
jgi:hypothetical protein